MLEPTYDHGRPARPWLPEEMAALDALREGRVVRRIPTTAEQAAAEWRAADPWTRRFLREVARLGHDSAQVGDDGRVYVTGVGAEQMILILCADVSADGITVERVVVGRETWTTARAWLFLRGRAAR